MEGSVLNIALKLPDKGLIAVTGELSDEERKALKALSDVLVEFVKRRPNMPLHQIIVMLSVALEEGKSLKTYSERTQYPTSSVSRTFLDNGPKMRTGEAGLGLLEARPSQHNLREYETHLSAKGKSFFKSIAKRMLGVCG